MDLPTAFTLSLALGVVGLLIAELAAWRAGVWIAKAVASASFVAVAASLAPWSTRYGQALFIGLVLSAVGDLVLVRKERKAWFLGGLVAFLAAHVAYIVAFTDLELGLREGLVVAAPIAVALVFVARWLWPHVPAAMKGPVALYMLAISTMAALAATAVLRGATPFIAAGAFGFYVSDIAVARDRFVRASGVNGAWGLPLYYAAQALLAWSLRAP